MKSLEIIFFCFQNEALLDMDATLIRNLSDHRGNNLFHVCCCFGHLDCLQWLMQRGKQCEDAILDENKCELTPVVCAVKVLDVAFDT